MSDWPSTMTVAPIRSWPGTLTPHDKRKPTPFSAPLTTTLKELNREIYQLVDTAAQQQSAELLVAIPQNRFRLDGRPYADAKPEHPGVIFSIDSRHGHLSYPCDTFTSWQDNLRAITLALEALRKVDRYGVTKRGEQYRGFLELESGSAMPASFTTAHGALEWLRAEYGETGTVYVARELLRMAQRREHPDAGGDASKWLRVQQAEAKLRAEGLI